MVYGGSLYASIRTGEVLSPEQARQADEFGARMFSAAVPGITQPG
jgi:2-keto-3-deoxy-6-phosphogluconate aldolase